MSGGPEVVLESNIQILANQKPKLFGRKKSRYKEPSFKDVAGLEGAKEGIEEIVEFLRNPE